MHRRAPIHLRPTAELAERVLLPGDPGRALALAQLLIEGPLMFNHHRGLWGYTGPALADGELLTIQSTGMGGPSAAIVLEELITLGARRAIRVGTCGALDGGLALGDLLVAREALATDGGSRALGAGERIAGDPELTSALSSAAAHMLASDPAHPAGEPAETGAPEEQAPDTRGAAEEDSDTQEPPAAERRIHPETVVASTDLFYEPNPERERHWRSAGAIAVEMETATLFAVGARRGVSVACVLAVSDVLGPSDQSGVGRQRQRIDDDPLLAAAEAMGRLAVSSLRA